MNERIQQLLLKAQTMVREEVKLTPELAKYAPSYAIPGTQIHVGLGLSYEKFAQLIVRECADYCKGHILPKDVAEQNGLTYNDGVGDCAIGLEQHFGVEE